MRRNDYDSHYDLEREKREKEKRRIAWMIQQKKDKEHEKLKQQKIEEYERNRAQSLALKHKRRSPHRSHSRSRSKSEESQHRSRSKFHNDKRQVMSEKLNSSEDNKPFFKGPDETPKYNENELRQVTVKILRKIAEPASNAIEIKRDVVNHEEIQLKRREDEDFPKSSENYKDNGEGSKPIFDRDELKLVGNNQNDVEERRVIEAVSRNNHGTKSYSKRRSASLSPHRRRGPSPSPSSRVNHHSKPEPHKRHHPNNHRNHHPPKDYKPDRYHSSKRNGSREDLRRHSTSSRARSPSRDRHYRNDRDYPRSSRSHRSRSNERSHEHRDRRESPRERIVAPPPPPYVEPVPYPYYFQPYPPRPMMIGPHIPPPIRPPMMRGRPNAAVRPPFPPRFIAPQDIYRDHVLDPRFGRMY